jgi:hypothetical protein
MGGFLLILHRSRARFFRPTGRGPRPDERRQPERVLAGLLVELGVLRDQLEASPAGLLGHYRPSPPSADKLGW